MGLVCEATSSSLFSKININYISFPIQQQINFLMANSTITVEPKENNQWLIQVQYHYQSKSGTGGIIVTQETSPNAENLIYTSLAGSLAWLELSEQKLKARDLDAALFCVQAGLDELGANYTSPLTIDDTGLKLLLAAERIQEGYQEDGIKIMIRMLDIRTKLYADLHNLIIPR